MCWDRQAVWKFVPINVCATKYSQILPAMNMQILSFQMQGEQDRLLCLFCCKSVFCKFLYAKLASLSLSLSLVLMIMIAIGINVSMISCPEHREFEYTLVLYVYLFSESQVKHCIVPSQLICISACCSQERSGRFDPRDRLLPKPQKGYNLTVKFWEDATPPSCLSAVHVISPILVFHRQRLPCLSQRDSRSW